MSEQCGANIGVLGSPRLQYSSCIVNHTRYVESDDGERLRARRRGAHERLCVPGKYVILCILHLLVDLPQGVSG